MEQKGGLKFIRKKNSIVLLFLNVAGIVILTFFLVSQGSNDYNNYQNYLKLSSGDSYNCQPNFLSMEERIYGLSLIWRKTSEMFGLWELLPKDFDWDKLYREYITNVLLSESLEEYFAMLSSFISNLRDGHSGVGFGTDNFYILPIDVDFIEGYLTVIGIDSRQTNISLGSRILQINQYEPLAFLEKYFGYRTGLQTSLARESRLAWFLSFSQSFSEPLDLKILNPNNYIFYETIERQYMRGFSYNQRLNTNYNTLRTVGYRDGFSVSVHENNIYRIIIPHFGNANMPNSLQRYLESIQDNLSGVILDIRDNAGGSGLFGWQVLANFVDAGELRFITNGWQERSAILMAEASMLDWQSDYFCCHNPDIHLGMSMLRNRNYVRPEWDEESFNDFVMHLNNNSLGLHDVSVVILTNHRAGSAGDDFAAVASSIGRFTIIGTNTMGTTGQLAQFELPGGGSFHLTTVRSLTYDGRDITNVGISPDIWVEQAFEDLLSGIDTQLRFAIKYLSE